MPIEKPPTLRSPDSDKPTRSRHSSTLLKGIPAAVAISFRWLRAVRAGWNPDASSTAPTRIVGWGR